MVRRAVNWDEVVLEFFLFFLVDAFLMIFLQNGSHFFCLVNGLPEGFPFVWALDGTS